VRFCGKGSWGGCRVEFLCVLKRIKSLLVYPCCACVTPSVALVRSVVCCWSRLGAVALSVLLEVSRVCSLLFAYCVVLLVPWLCRGWCGVWLVAFVRWCCVLAVSGWCSHCFVVFLRRLPCCNSL